MEITAQADKVTSWTVPDAVPVPECTNAILRLPQQVVLVVGIWDWGA